MPLPIDDGDSLGAAKLYLGSEHPAYTPILAETVLTKDNMQCLLVRVPDLTCTGRRC